jgi:hypothetical protein
VTGRFLQAQGGVFEYRGKAGSDPAVGCRKRFDALLRCATPANRESGRAAGDRKEYLQMEHF